VKKDINFILCNIKFLAIRFHLLSGLTKFQHVTYGGAVVEDG